MAHPVAFVHAHPDDESIFTGGALITLAQRGQRTLLVTCTDGRLGLDHQIKAGCEDGHDQPWTRATRAGELGRAIEILGVSRALSLGFRDSGLAGWPQSAHPDAFINQDVDRVANQLAAVLDDEGVRVVVTYDEHGYYGHPDHIHAHLVTLAAAQRSQTVERVLYPVTPRRVLEAFRPAAKAKRVFLPGWVVDAGEGVDDDVVAVTVDAVSVAPLKQRAIAAHASQVDNADLMTMDAELFELLFGHEYYQLGWSRRGAPIHPTDLAGERSE